MAAYLPSWDNPVAFWLNAIIQENPALLDLIRSGQYSPFLSSATSQAIMGISNTSHSQTPPGASNNFSADQLTSFCRDAVFDYNYTIAPSFLVDESHRISTVDSSTHASPGTLVSGNLPNSALWTGAMTPETPTWNGLLDKIDEEYPSNESPHDLRCHWRGCKYSKPFKCAYTLTRHVESVHVNPTRFECPDAQCDRAFGRKDKLNEHYKVHSKQQGNRGV